MFLLLAAFALFAGGATLALVYGHEARRATLAGAGGALAGCVLGLAYAFTVLVQGRSQEFSFPWALAGGSLRLFADPFAAVFLVVTFVVVAAAALFGSAYLLAHAGARRLGGVWAQFNALSASIALVFVAGDGWVFLLAWESVALSSFMLVMYDTRDPRVSAAGWMYLVAAHLGTAFLLVLFALLSANAGSMSFDRWDVAPSVGAPLSGLLFVLAVLGFGAKAGVVPLHVWLPEAHPAAPSHVSAIMSAVMIKVGVYGLVRALGWLGAPEAWWGTALVAVGATSAVLGVLLALPQRDMKRLLAYCSVENMGIIFLGLGVGLLGTVAGAPAVAFLGFAGATLHVVTHALSKALLFLGAGAVHHGAGTRDFEELGGLMGPMPQTGAAFVVGSVSIAGLPPMAGFVSEFLILMGAFAGASTLPSAFAVPLAAAAGALALTGGLASACFVKATGSAFLGVARSQGARAAREAPWMMRAPQLALASGCVGLGLGGSLVVRGLVDPVSAAFRIAPAEASRAALAYTPALEALGLAGLFVVCLTLALSALRARLHRGREVSAGPTWDCGALTTTSRMQYTSSSFTEPITSYFEKWTGTWKQHLAPDGRFPTRAHFGTGTPDPASRHAFEPLFQATSRSLARLLPLQSGRVQAYVAYVAVAALGLLVLEVVAW